MYTLTERRMANAKPILDKYVDILDQLGRFSTGAFEHELRDALDTGYREIKDVVIQLFKKHGGDYGRVAEYYMRHQGHAVVLEFKQALGISDYAQQAK